MKSHWIEHKGKHVFIAEYSGFGMNAVGLKAELDEIRIELKKYPLASMMIISNVAGTSITRDNVQVLMGMLSYSNQFVRKRAVIGLTPTSAKFLGMFNKITGRARFHPFDTLEQALDWIVEDD